jgi:hypothetical protein
MDFRFICIFAYENAITSSLYEKDIDNAMVHDAVGIDGSGAIHATDVDRHARLAYRFFEQESAHGVG